MSLTSYRAAPPRATKYGKVAAAARIFPFVRPQKRRVLLSNWTGCCYPASPYRRFAECRAFACKYALTHCVLQKQKAACAAFFECLCVVVKMILFRMRLFGRLRYERCVWQTWQRPTLPRLETKYHWRRGVSRPSSEWDRVQPPRCNHQVSKAQRSRMRFFRRMRYK